MTKYKDIKEVNFNDIVDTGTEGTKIALGTSAQRGSTQGQLRFNSTTNLAEYYDGTQFKSIDAPPVITSIDDGEIDSQAGGNQTIVISGSNFSSTVTVLLEATSGASITPSTVTRNSSSQITITHPKNQFVNANEPYSVKVTNNSGLSSTLANAIYVDNVPSWSTPAGALTGSPFNENSSINVTLSATDPDGDAVTYSLQSGAFPTGINLDSATGVLSGTLPEETATTTYSFTIRATANGKTTDRAFSLVSVNDTAPTWTTASGSIATVYDSARTGFSTTVVASDVDGDTITYSVLSGSLPAGASLNSATGVISGNLSSVGSDTTSSFTLRATANGKTVDRAFSITVKPQVVQTFNYTGSNQTWTVPSGLTSATVKLWGAGGGSDSNGSGQYGAGGGFAQGTVSLTPSSTMYLVVGQGGALGTWGGSAGSGGGYAGLFTSSVSHANAIIIAGGGGGAGDDNRGGEGGGLTGTQGYDNSPQYNNGGRGGTQSAGGAAGNVGYSSGSGVLPTAGSALQGGDGGADNGAGHTYTPASYGGGGRGGYEPGGSQGGGGGGGGYYGGGGGDGNAFGANGGGGAGGGGGSSYLHPTLITNGSTTSGSSTSSGGASDPYYSSNIGDAGTSRAGGNGKIVIIY